MSTCRTCEYALYDGMCLAQGKFTLLDAPACDNYKPRIDAEVSKLKAENAKLRELVRDMWRFTGAACKKHPRLFDPSAAGGQMVQLNALDSFEQRMRELGVGE